MQGFVDQCVERYLPAAGTNSSTLRQVATPGIDDSAFSTEYFEIPGRLAPLAASVLMKIIYLARCRRFDLLHPVSLLAREVTEWNRACDKRLHRLVCDLNSTRTRNLEAFVGDEPCDCTMIVYADTSYADDSNNSRSTSASSIALVGPNTSAPITAICNKSDSGVTIVNEIRDRVSRSLGAHCSFAPSSRSGDKSVRGSIEVGEDCPQKRRLPYRPSREAEYVPENKMHLHVRIPRLHL